MSFSTPSILFSGRSAFHRSVRQNVSGIVRLRARHTCPSLCSNPHLPHTQPFSTSTTKDMPPKKESNGSVGGDAHQYQAGDTTHKKEDEWKHREPYRIHDNDENFDVKWKGKCHCGKVTYELSRDKPLASKYCHCTTCQRLHGVISFHYTSTIAH